MLFLLIALPQPAVAEEVLRLAVVGDTQTDGSHSSINWDVLPGVVAGAEAQGATHLLVAGDLVGGSSSLSATVSQWEDFKLATEEFSGEVFAVPGNHDVYGGSGTFEAWRETFPHFPQDDSPEGEEGVSYYVDHGDVRVIFVTSDHPSNSYRLSSEGLAWLDRVLGESGELDHVFVITHHPVSFSDASGHGGTAGELWQLLVAHGVAGLFVGHWHRYQPGQLGAGGDTWETILGTGGGWQGYEPSRPYQQLPGFVLLEIEGADARATFYGDGDGDGAYDDALDSYLLATASPGPTGLLARYTFDDGTAEDSAPEGKAIHGTLEGGATVSETADGPSGAWLDLSGNADFVEAGSIGDYILSQKGGLTLSTFARVGTAPTNASWGATLLTYATNDYYTEDEETNYSWWLSVRPDGSLLAFWEHGSGSNVSLASTEASALLDGSWHHVALVRDAGASEVRFYVDGAQLGEAVGYTEAPTGGARGLLYLGSDTREYAGSYDLGGALDEVCIFDLALSAEEVARLAVGEDCEEVAGLGGDTGGDDTGGDGTGGEGSGSGSGESGADDGGGDAGGDTGGDTGGDAGGGPVDAEPGGCGCAQAGPGRAPGGLGLLVLGLALSGVRRRPLGAPGAPEGGGSG